MNPLIQECGAREKKVRDLKEVLTTYQKTVKKLQAIVKMPKLTEMFRRVSKLRLTEE